MASFNANQLNASGINGGQQFANGNAFTPQNANAIVEGILYLNGKVGSGSSGGTSGNAKIYLHKLSIKQGESDYYFYSTKEEVFCTADYENIIIPTNYVTTILGGAYFEYDSSNRVYMAKLFSHKLDTSQTVITPSQGETIGFAETSEEIIL